MFQETIILPTTPRPIGSEVPKDSPLYPFAIDLDSRLLELCHQDKSKSITRRKPREQILLY